MRDPNEPLSEGIEYHCPVCGNRIYDMTTHITGVCDLVTRPCAQCRTHSAQSDPMAEGVRYALNRLLSKGAPQCKVTVPLNPDLAVNYIAGIGLQKKKP